MKNVALYLSGVNNIKGGGGAERFFADFFSIYKSWPNKKFKIYFFIDEITLSAIQSINKLNDTHQIIILKSYSNRFKKELENLDLFIKLMKFKINIFHCANFGRHDFNRLNFVARKTNIKTILNIVDCQVPYVLANKKDYRYKDYHERYLEMPYKIKFDGIFSWYEKFLVYINNNGFYKWNPLIKNIYSRFVDQKKFQPSIKKENTIVFASRMHFQKKPDWFLKAVKYLKENYPNIINNWKFLFVGDGDLAEELEIFIEENDLNDLVHRLKNADLSEIFSKSSCFVSTQDFENFPSMSMMEAMACENAIIARDVGQTNLMLKNKVNGFFIEEDNAIGLAMTIKKYIEMDEADKRIMQKESLKLVQEVHTPCEFINQIEDFWVNLFC